MVHPYSTSIYAKTLSHLGHALHIPEWETSVLIRPIKPGYKDALGIYPLTVLNRQADIAGGLARLRKHQLISIVLVIDDVHRPSLEQLNKHFDFVKPFKTHYIYRPNSESLSYPKHHQYELRQALKKPISIAPIDLTLNIEHWNKLYASLIEHKKLKEQHVFPLEHHAALGKLDGVTAIGAWENDELI